MLTARPKRAATLDDFSARLNAAILLPACQSVNRKHSTVELKSAFTKSEQRCVCVCVCVWSDMT
jgi:hypothetical protein